MNQLGEALLTLRRDRRSTCCSSTTPTRWRPHPTRSACAPGLEREDLFTVVFDQVRTDTALYADVVLPATAFLEHRELARGYGALRHPSHRAGGRARRARRGPNYEVFAELTRRLGLAKPGRRRRAGESCERALLDGSDGEPQPRWRSSTRPASATRRAAPRPIQFVDDFPRTADRKAHLVPDGARPRGAARPLHLPARPGDGGGAAGAHLAGDQPHDQQLPRPPAPRPGAARDAPRRRRSARPARRRPRPGVERVRRGGHRACKLNADLRPGVACLPKGLWAKHTDNGRTANALAPPPWPISAAAPASTTRGSRWRERRTSVLGLSARVFPTGPWRLLCFPHGQERTSRGTGPERRLERKEGRRNSPRGEALHDEGRCGRRRRTSREAGSELVIHRKDGTIQSKDSHGRDPLPPRDHR